MNQNTYQKMCDFAGVQSDGQDVLGKLLYYSLSSLLVEKTDLSDICDSIGFPYEPTRRAATADAFRSATGEIEEREVVKETGGPSIFKVYCRDNKSPKGMISRELVKETVGEHTNQYKKLANLSLDRQSGAFSYDNLAFDPHVDPLPLCLNAQEQFELYQRCIGRRQVETMLDNYLDSMRAVKVINRGKMFFIPRDQMDRIGLFEDFIELLEQHNRSTKARRLPLDSNSMFVVDDAKQRSKMAAAFYRSVRREIETYQEKVSDLIRKGTQSVAVMDRWVQRIQGLEEKKRLYEDVLRQELNELDDEFTGLRYLSDELLIRSRGLRASKKQSVRLPQSQAA